MKPVFLDTVGLIAVWERSDQWHQSANAVFRRLLADGVPLLTTPQILLECGNSAARRPFRSDVTTLRRDLAAVGGLIIPTSTDEDAAWALYAQGEAGQAGIVDQISFVVMRRLGITEAFTNDRHFLAAGFAVLF